MVSAGAFFSSISWALCFGVLAVLAVLAQGRSEVPHYRAFANKGGTGHWPVPSGDPPDGTGAALYLPAETKLGGTGHWPVLPGYQPG